MKNDPYVGYGGAKKTPQSHPIPGEEEKMAKNAAGGFAFKLDPWIQFERFLILGSAGGTYYVKERDFTRENAEVLRHCIQEDSERALSLIMDVRQFNCAPKLQPGLFALALWATYADKKLLTDRLHGALLSCARTLSNLYTWIKYVRSLRGNGRAIRRAVRIWFTAKSVKSLVYQGIKYRAREGYELRDVLRIFKPKDHEDKARKLFYQWAVGKLNGNLDMRGIGDDAVESLVQLSGYLALSDPTFSGSGPDLIRRWKLPREAVPNTMLNRPQVWDALLDDMPMVAMVRNLGKMTNVGLLSDFSDASRKVCSRLTNPKRVKESGVHPFQLLLAANTYRMGTGVRGKLTWSPVDAIRDALEEAFYLSFGNVKPTGKNIVLALDVSASMGWNFIRDSKLEAARAAACMAMVTARVEPIGSYKMVAFSTKLCPLDISPKDSLKGVLKKTNGLPHGGTDCAIPMQVARHHRWPVDAFVVYTDNETWAGNIHPVQALREFRKEMQRPAKLIVVGMTSTHFSIADPKDPGMLDVVGFDGACPALISDFIGRDQAQE